MKRILLSLIFLLVALFSIDAQNRYVGTAELDDPLNMYETALAEAIVNYDSYHRGLVAKGKSDVDYTSCSIKPVDSYIKDDLFHIVVEIVPSNEYHYVINMSLSSSIDHYTEGMYDVTEERSEIVYSIFLTKRDEADVLQLRYLNVVKEEVPSEAMKKAVAEGAASIDTSEINKILSQLEMK
ncbi:MAG: hypothetical protein IKV75_04525 [Bacteroidales bacterium]|nr:hypothetical protein [Bacteroidales bacterium]